MKTYIEDSFDPSKPEEYKWWDFVEPLEIKCAAYNIMNQIDSIKSRGVEDSHGQSMLYGYRMSLNALAMCSTTERGKWGK